MVSISANDLGIASQIHERACRARLRPWYEDASVGAGQRRAINPRAYLHWLISRLPLATNQTVHTLTPAAYAAAMQESAPPQKKTRPESSGQRIKRFEVDATRHGGASNAYSRPAEQRG